MNSGFTEEDYHFSENFFDKFSFPIMQANLGDILLAEPFLEDGNFARSVIYLTEKNKESAMGFILNRPTGMMVGELLPELGKLPVEVYYGGPVGNDKLFYLHTFGAEIRNSAYVKGNLFWGGNFKDLKKLHNAGIINSSNTKFFAGYSGWGEGQLDDELEQKSWIVSSFDENNIFDSFKDHLWHLCLKKLGRKYEIMTHFPTDPNMN
jgi:putative transcriptional regulator